MTLLFHDKELMELMQDFYVLTGIKIVMFDENYTELISYPLDKKTFCMHMRESEEFDTHCRHCDEQACKKCSISKSLEIYTCHAGLTEAVAPIKENGKIIGYMMFGQVTENKSREAFTKQMNELRTKFGINTDLARSIQKIKYKSRKQILAAGKILDAFTEYILLKEMVQLSGEQLIKDIERYIENHISEDIPVERLCREYNIGRTRLYETIKQYTSGGIASFIRRKRLEKAKHLLKSTEMKISEISSAVGFSDYNYFLRVFKKEFGISPKKFLRS